MFAIQSPTNVAPRLSSIRSGQGAAGTAGTGRSRPTCSAMATQAVVLMLTRGDQPLEPLPRSSQPRSSGTEQSFLNESGLGSLPGTSFSITPKRPTPRPSMPAIRTGERPFPLQCHSRRGHAWVQPARAIRAGGSRAGLRRGVAPYRFTSGDSTTPTSGEWVWSTGERC